MSAALRKTAAILTDHQLTDLFQAAYDSGNVELCDVLSDERVQRTARGLDDERLADYAAECRRADHPRALRLVTAEQTTRALAG